MSYDIQDVNGEMQIVANFVKDGEVIHKVHKINDGHTMGAGMVAKLLNSDFAKAEAEQIIERANASKHSPFKQ